MLFLAVMVRILRWTDRVLDVRFKFVFSCIARSHTREFASSLVLDSPLTSITLPLALRTESLSLDPNPASFRAVVFDQLAEPRVLQRLPGSNALLRIVDEDLPKQIEEQFVELCGWRDDFVQTLHGANELARLARSVGERIRQVLVLEEAGGAVAIAALTLLHHFADERLVDLVASNSLMDC
jgi:hypothetical protein